MGLDMVGFCVALAVAVISTGVVDAMVILPRVSRAPGRFYG